MDGKLPSGFSAHFEGAWMGQAEHSFFVAFHLSLLGSGSRACLRFVWFSIAIPRVCQSLYVWVCRGSGGMGWWIGTWFGWARWLCGRFKEMCCFATRRREGPWDELMGEQESKTQRHNVTLSLRPWSSHVALSSRRNMGVLARFQK